MRNFKALAVGTLLIGGALLAILLLAHSGCMTTYVPDATGTNYTAVQVIDPVKLANISAAIEPAASAVLRRAMINSPQHAPQIVLYATAIGRIFCQAQQTQQFSPLLLIAQADVATLTLQTNLPPEVIDAKNAALAIYKIAFNEKLTVTVPTNGWPYAVCGIFCDSIDRALKDAGQPGVK